MNFEQRVEGAILGAMIGDCVASPYLFSKSDVLRKDRARIGWEVHSMSDESQLLILGLRTIDVHGMRYDSLIRAYQQWVRSTPGDLDYVMSEVFGSDGRLNARTLWAMASQHDFGSVNSASLLVRQIPIVLSAWRKEDEKRLLETIDNVTRLTHTDEQTREICQLYALTLALAIRGTSRLQIWDELQRIVRYSSSNTLIINSYYESPCMDKGNYSSNQLTFQRVLYDLWHSQSFVSSIRSCILSGGATDMNCAAVGALLGAYYGSETLPTPWVDALLRQNPILANEALDHAKHISERQKRFKPTETYMTSRNRRQATLEKLPQEHQNRLSSAQSLKAISSQSHSGIHSSSALSAISRSSQTHRSITSSSLVAIHDSSISFHAIDT